MVANLEALLWAPSCSDIFCSTQEMDFSADIVPPEAFHVGLWIELSATSG